MKNIRILLFCSVLAGIVISYVTFHDDHIEFVSPADAPNLNLSISNSQSPIPSNIPRTSNKLSKQSGVAINTISEEQLAGVKKIASTIKDSLESASSRVKASKSVAPEIREKLDALDEKYASSDSTGVLLDSNGTLTSIFPKYTASFDTSNPDAFQNASSDLLTELDGAIGIGQSDELIPQKVTCFGEESCSATFERRLNGYPILNSAVVVSGDQGRINSISGALNSPAISPEVLKTANSIDKNSLEQKAKSYLSDNGFTIDGEPQYGIYTMGYQAFPAYKFKVSKGVFESYSLTLNANTSTFIEKESLVADVTNSSGTDLNGNTYNFVSVLSGPQYLMIDDRFPLGSKTFMRDAKQQTFDELDLSQAEYVSSSSQSGDWNQSAVSALSHFDALVEFFEQKIGYTVGEDSSNDMTMIVNINGFNAKAGENILLFGKTTDADFANARDVVGHELTHSVIRSTSNLRYFGQSGALNESFADLFGTLAENKEEWWILGEDIRQNGNYDRSLANPTTGSPSQPAHINNYVYTNEDNGGVHYNSGIPNRFFYLLVEGLTNEELGTSLGRQRTAEIAFSTMLALPPDATFAQFFATIKSKATEDNEIAAVDAAGKAVGFDRVLELDESRTSQTSNPFNAEDGNIAVYLYPNYLFGWYDVYLQAYNSTDRTPNSELNIRVGLNAKRVQPLAAILEGQENFVIMYMSNSGDLQEISQLDGEEYTGVAISAEEFAEYGLTIKNLALAKDRSKVSISFEEIGVFFVIDFNSLDVTIIEPELPSYTENTSIVKADSVDSMRFDPTNRKIAFDFRVCSNEANNDCYWTVGIYDLVSNKYFYPFPAQPSNYLVGFPVFSNQSDNYIALDIVNVEDGSSAVFIYNFSTDEIEPIAKTKLDEVTGVRFGNPSFVQDDSSLVFTATYGNGADQSLLIGVELDDYKRLEGTNSYPISPDISVFGRSEPFAVKDVVPSLIAEKTSHDFGLVIETVEHDLCITNDGAYDIVLDEFSIPEGIGLTILGLDQVFDGGETICSRFTLDPSTIELGSYVETISISHDGKNSPLLLSFNAEIDIDTDGDGVGNSVDDDDDGDNVADTADAFPLDKNEQVDNDKDGVGDNADTDDDNDGLDDIFEIENGLNPLNADSDFDGLNDTEEFRLGTNPTNPDSDSDGLNDDYEITLGTNPINADTDFDGLMDGKELTLGTHPLLSDSDGDGYSDGDEVGYGSDPLAGSSEPSTTNNSAIIKAIIDRNNDRY